MNSLSTHEITIKNGKLYRGHNQVAQIKCTNCDNIIYRSFSYLKKSKFKSFCSEWCKQIDRDPKAEIFMSNEKSNPDAFYYLIGLIATDGHITRPKCDSYCEIRLSFKDQDSVDLLNNIQKIFGGKVKQEGIGIVWNIYNFEFVTFLKSIGLTQRKSLTLNINRWFNGLSQENKWSFIRGVIDGDGNFSIGKKFATSSICTASTPFKNTIFNFLANENIPTFEYERKGNKNPYWILRTNSSNITKLKPIYNNKSLFLERKYNKFLEIQNRFVTLI